MLGQETLQEIDGQQTLGFLHLILGQHTFGHEIDGQLKLHRQQLLDELDEQELLHGILFW